VYNVAVTVMINLHKGSKIRHVHVVRIIYLIYINFIGFMGGKPSCPLGQTGCDPSESGVPVVVVHHDDVTSDCTRLHEMDHYVQVRVYVYPYP